MAYNKLIDLTLLSNFLTKIKGLFVSTITYDGTNKKITKTINGTTSDVVTVSTLKTDMALNNVENKSSATICNELTTANIRKALGYIPTEERYYPNMFHNWYFGPDWPINQRGEDSYDKNGMTVDRWKLNKVDELSESYVSITDNYLHFYAAGGTGDSLSQVIYNSGLSVGNYITCTVYQADGTVLSTTFPITQSLSTHSYTGESGWLCGAEIVGEQVVVHPLIIDFANRSINIVAVKLEPGWVDQTLVYNGHLINLPDYAAELNHCLSFYRKIAETSCPGIWRGNNIVRFSLPAPAACGTYTAALDNNDIDKGFYLAQDTGMTSNLTPSFTVLGTGSGRLYISASISETGISFAPFSSVTVVPVSLIIENGM